MAQLRAFAVALLVAGMALVPAAAFSAVSGESVESGKNAEPELVTVTGTLSGSAESGYALTAGTGRNRTTYRLVPYEGAGEAYNALSARIGQTVTASGIVTAQKSRWNLTLALLRLE